MVCRRAGKCEPLLRFNPLNFAKIVCFAKWVKGERKNDLRERIPHTWPSSHENYFQSIFGSVSYCVVILRTPPYWSVIVASCHFKLGSNSFHCRSRTVSDMTCKLDITFVDESKDFYFEKSGQSSCRKAKRSWLLEVHRRKWFRLDGNC